MFELIALGGLGFLAGFVDAAVGGGGLIQLPAIMVFGPSINQGFLHHPLVFGTNKFASIWGTISASINFNKQIGIEKDKAIPSSISAFIFSFAGASAVTLVPVNYIKPIVLTLLIAVLIYTLKKKEFGASANIAKCKRPLLLVTIIGGAIGFYDGFFGPGTGSFLIFLFISIIGMDFLKASALAKIVNISTNFAALVFFIPAGHVLFRVAIPLAICNFIGGYIGSHLAISKGNRFVRILFIVVVTALVSKLGWDILKI